MQFYDGQECVELHVGQEKSASGSETDDGSDENEAADMGNADDKCVVDMGMFFENWACLLFGFLLPVNKRNVNSFWVSFKSSRFLLQ